MWSTLTLAAALVIGYEIAARVWRADELRSVERAAFVSIAGASLWLASTWALALTHLMTRPMLIARTLMFVAIAMVILARRLRGSDVLRRQVDVRALLVFGLPLLPVLLWVIFVLWRSAIVPPLTHDALSYHLVRALLFARDAGYSSLSSLRWMITPRPANYELLLAEAIAMDRVDDYTEWLSVFSFIGFVIAAAALGQRWSRGNPRVTVAVALLAASSPVTLLHTGAHKNDLMTAYFLTAAVVATGRWLSDADRRALIVAAAGFCLAIGTKTPAFLVALFLLPFVVWKMYRERLAWKTTAALALAAAILFLALGAWSVIQARDAVAPSAPPAAKSAEVVDERQYGDWSNLWKGPWILLAAPVSQNSYVLSVPWSKGDWYWRRYEIYFSELGVAFTICALLLPFALWREPSLERIAIIAAMVASVAVILPVHRVPLGIHLVGLPRIVMYVTPAVFAAVLATWTRFAHTAMVAGSLLFVVYGVTCAEQDNFVSFDYVLWARAHPGTRVVPFAPNRPAEVVDRAAGPNDVIAMAAEGSSWVYPAYGRNLTRRVELIGPGEGPPVIPADAQWLVVDQSWRRIWGDPKFTDLSQWRTRVSQGTPSDEDLRVTRYALAHPEEWQPVFIPPGNQSVFRRRR